MVVVSGNERDNILVKVLTSKIKLQEDRMQVAKITCI
jgi:hypothetical protein